MNPIAFYVGPVPVHWYGILAAIGFFWGYLLTRRNALRFGMPEDEVETFLFWLSVVIIVGARLGAVVPNWQYYAAHPEYIIRIDRGGLGSHGAIIASLLFGYLWTRRTAISFGKMADAIAPALPIGHIVIRIGNFINGELFGSPTTLPWAVEFPASGGPVHPVQLYEALISVVILFLATRWTARPRYPGYAFMRVMLVHSVVRLFLDFLRQHTTTYGPFVLTQLIALAFVIGISAILWYREIYLPNQATIR